MVRVGSGNSGSSGGDLLMYAGSLSAPAGVGGSVVISAGEGSSTAYTNGGDGGKVQIFGGAAQGGNEYDDGGNVEIAGGFGRNGLGGSLILRTGYGYSTSSGLIDIATGKKHKTISVEAILRFSSFQQMPVRLVLVVKLASSLALRALEIRVTFVWRYGFICRNHCPPLKLFHFFRLVLRKAAVVDTSRCWLVPETLVWEE